MAGCSRDELIGGYFLDFYPEGAAWFPCCQQARETEKTVHACFYSEEAKHWLDFIKEKDLTAGKGRLG